MKKVKIQISGMYDITQFIEHASKVEEPGVIVYKGSTMIDGSSLMGMLNLDTTHGIIVEYPQDAQDFDDFVQKFMSD